MKIIIAFFVIAFLAGSTLAQDQIQSQPNQSQEGVQGWYQQISGTANSLRGVKFTSKDTGWVASDGGIILRTVDGGQNWVQLPVPDPLGVSCIDAVDGKTAWCSDAGSHGNMFFTNNGGQSWIQQIPNSGNNGISALSFPTLNIGYGAGGLGTLIKTTNGGTTWTDKFIGAVPVYTLHFLDSLNGLVAGEETIFRVYNGGSQFITQRDSSLFVLCTFYGCCLVTPMREFAVGAGKEAAIVRTKDGGKTWDRAIIPLEFQTAVMNAITFTDSLNGTVVGDQGAILHTTDGGDSWNKQVSGVKADLNGVSFVDSLNGTAVGINGVVLHTVNGGYSWVNPIQQDSLIIQTYPNPATQSLNFNYSLPSSQNITLSLFDVAGRSMGLVLNNSFQTEGNHIVPLNTALFPNGTYYYQFESAKYFSTGQFSIIH